MLDYLAVLGTAADRLDAAGIPYMLTGSTAMAAHGQPRMMRDIDIVVAVEAADAGRESSSAPLRRRRGCPGCRSAAWMPMRPATAILLVGLVAAAWACAEPASGPTASGRAATA